MHPLTPLSVPSSTSSAFTPGPAQSIPAQEISEPPATSIAPQPPPLPSSSPPPAPPPPPPPFPSLSHGQSKDVVQAQSISSNRGENSGMNSQELQLESNVSSKQVEVEPPVQPNTLTGVQASPSDSDMDMEDDITEPGEPQFQDQDAVPKEESTCTADEGEIHKHENTVQKVTDSSFVNLSFPTTSGAECGKKSYGQIESGSPIRLIQNYASDDTSEEDDESCPKEGNSTASSRLDQTKCTSSHEGIVCSDLESRSHQVTNDGLSESVTVSAQYLLSTVLPSEAKEAVPLLTGAGEAGKLVDYSSGRNPGHNVSSEFVQEKDSPGNAPVDYVSGSDRVHEEDKNNASTSLKVDEFGRLIREGISESDSDDSHYMRRQSRRRRSRSRSQSPPDRKKSPWRRKERRRSRSRSWSPRRRRSRSRSPYRRPGDYGNEKHRRGKASTPECFDFFKGRCYRGASCRYVHHESGKHDGSRHHRSNQQLVEVTAGSRNFTHHQDGEDRSVRTSFGVDELKSKDAQLNKIRQDSNISALKDEEEYLNYGEQGSHFGHDDKEFNIDGDKFDSSTDVDARSLQASKPQESLIESISDPPKKYPEPGTSTISQDIHHPQAPLFAEEHSGINDQAQKIDGLETSAPFIHSSTSLCHIAVSQSPLSRNTDEPTGLKDPLAVDSSVKDLPLHGLQLPPPPPLPPHGLQLLADYNSMSSTMNFPLHSVGKRGVPPYQLVLPSQQSPYPLLQNPPWSAPPPPPTNLSGAPSQFQQGGHPIRNDLLGQASVRSNNSELPSHSQVGGLQRPVYSSLQEPLRPVEFPESTLQNHPYLPPQHSLFHSQQYVSDGTPANAAGSFPLTRYSSDVLDRDHTSRFSDIGGSRIPSHYNPYASTFDQPLPSKFSSSAFREDESPYGSKYDRSLSVNHVPKDSQKAGSDGFGWIMTSNSVPRGQTFPGSGKDQYDPLSDSIEPSSESFRKHVLQQDQAADNSDMLRLSDSHKPLDVEGNSKNKEAGAVAANTSPENDECGETADAEVGAVENGSPGDSIDGAEAAGGEIEIDQVKPTDQKNKDSRSMKLFKVELANFVKEILKPSWREGNMSKEAFKTIVKKTVDKVSGAMKGHRVPKSKAKIDQYIGSSHKKLTKLVEGYVNKFAKA